MHAAVRHAAWSFHPPFRESLRIVARRRFPLPSHSFHRSAIAYRAPEDPPGAASAPQDVESSPSPVLFPEEANEETVATENEEAPASLVERPQRTKDRSSNYGSAARRSVRNKKPKELPSVTVGETFLARNVKLADEVRPAGQMLAIYDDEGTETSSAARYQLHRAIWNEVTATIHAGLSLPTPAHAESFPAVKSHILLQCPKDGGVFFLDAVVEAVAAEARADVVTIDAQDIAEIAGDNVVDKPELSPYTIRSLGYETQLAGRQDSREMDEGAEEEEDMEEEDYEEPSSPARNSRSPFGLPSLSKMGAIPIGTFSGSMDNLIKTGKLIFGNNVSSGPGLNSFSRQPARQQGSSPDHSEADKLLGIAAVLLASGRFRRQLKRSHDDTAEDTPEDQQVLATRPPQPLPATPLIVLIRDYKEIQSTGHGRNFLGILHDQIRVLRKGGSNVILVGTGSSADLLPSLSKPGVRNIQSEYEEGAARSIVVTPRRTINQDSVFSEDERRRMREINLRHLQDMIRLRAPDGVNIRNVIQDEHLRLDSSLEFGSGLEDSVWSYDRVHRVAVSALGCLGSGSKLTVGHVEAALRMLDASDDVKFQWAADEKQQQKWLEEPALGKSTTPLTSASAKNKDSEDKIKRIRKGCNSHEKKLLSGVINPENIATTFSDVRSPSETIEALKTLTSLSLVRPEAFSYGVLATDKIPGLLLYGPPGTGKTLLAKAVAKESGATMLEVSGSEVYDMYVGEGEKNVKAIFTLAKKLRPCVVFIDEADAIFGSRSGQSNRTSHRELINQFLREWDGMNELSAFIMVATNRPFDLDDAVLRRLPRRLLVDLPMEKDREAILAIHLKNEVLEASVSLSDLARDTPFYSGSDLKNLAVASALACVREENDDAAKHTDATEPYKFPEKRTLARRHFDQAMQEISASISEDMGSLAAVRKFDEKYGDRRGRRKKRAGYGFRHADEVEKLETGRVRN